MMKKRHNKFGYMLKQRRWNGVWWQWM